MELMNGSTKILGVIGHPISHTLSPRMHNAAIASLGENYVYLPLPVVPERLEVALDGLAAIGVVGFNATIPHKEALIPLMAEVTPLASSIGAVNTVWRGDRGWCGTNTDVAGFIAPLRQIEEELGGKTAVILGCGGAARAVVAGCRELGYGKTIVVGRDAAKLASFQRSWRSSPLAIDVEIAMWEDLANLAGVADLLVNTTPIGMHPQGENTPMSADILAKIAEGTIVYDLIYKPRPTLFLQLAKERGAITLDGLEMLVCQGATALELWLQQPVPIDVMKKAII
jgi:shikimate dehydrogenase